MDEVANNGFEKSYIRLRKQEDRLYSDTDVFNLPDTSRNHPHHREWQIRKQSASRLITYLQKKHRPLQILEIGCGNGWLSNQLSAISDTSIIGIDINQQELNQAKRVFASTQNLQFLWAELYEIKKMGFDIIVFAASLQYFSPLKQIIDSAIELLGKNGEIHIIDTIFYTRSQVGDAQNRSAIYFDHLDCIDMARHYYHHCYDDLDLYNYSIMYKPRSVYKLFQTPFNPFPWIQIRKTENDIY